MSNIELEIDLLRNMQLKLEKQIHEIKIELKNQEKQSDGHLICPKCDKELLITFKTEKFISGGIDITDDDARLITDTIKITQCVCGYKNEKIVNRIGRSASFWEIIIT